MSTALEIVRMTRAASPPGLVPVNGLEPPNRIEEQYAIRQAAEIGGEKGGKNGIDFVFFRQFSDGRSSQVAAWVIDNSDERLSDSDLAEIHRKLWLNGCSPLLYVGWQTRVDILSCARGPDFWKGQNVKYDPADMIEVSSQIELELDQLQMANRYSAHRLSDGTFWDDPDNSWLAESGKAAHQQLINAVVETDKEIEGEKFPILRRLLLLTVLIKYLEDRNVFPPRWFRQYDERAMSFFDLLQHASPETIKQMLAALGTKFKGDVFELPEDQRQLTPKELREFAKLVHARTRGGEQLYLWQQYSFQHIPVEVLSHLYQHFAQKNDGAVFTPPFLANLMLDYAMPYEHLTGYERILDPTCGSGVFLAGAFRRLVHLWRSKNGWQQPDVPTLKGILNRSIFGVELQPEAVHLTAFNLALAICDALQPNVIWRELKFDKLVGGNLRIGDFSDWLSTLSEDDKRRGFTTIIGNPPFKSELTASAIKWREHQKRKVAVPDNQIAYFLLEQATDLLAAEGTLCLLQPQGILYNGNTFKFHRNLISDNTLHTVLDFVSVRKLFDGADPKTLALIIKRKPPKADHSIAHLTFRRTFSVKERIAFELDHYDRHLVPQHRALRYPWTWRANLLGGGRLQSLAQRLDEMPKLKHFLQGKKETHDWDYGEGFILAAKEPLHRARWLTGKPLLPTNAFGEAGIDQSKVRKVTAKKFRSSYSKARYSAPIVMIKEVESLPVVLRTRNFLAYRHQIVGIHAPRREEKQLRQFYAEFLSNRTALRASCALFGNRALSGKATSILKRDIEQMPWPSAGEGWHLSWWEQLLCQETIDLTGDFIRLGQNSRLLQEQVDDDGLLNFARVFVRMLVSVYTNLRAAGSGRLNGLAYQVFCFGSQPELQWSGDWGTKLEGIIYKERGDTLRTIRLLRFYEGNTIILVKPDRLRYWIGSTAIRDADETIVDLYTQGY